MIRWAIILISIDSKIIITQILINGSAPVAKINGKPPYNNKLDNLFNHSVLEIAEMVKKNIGSDIKLNKIHSDDTRSYHISSEKIKNYIGFKTNLTIEDAVKDLRNAFKNRLLINTFEDENFFNIKRMKSIDLK